MGTDPQREEDFRQVGHPRGRWILALREASHGAVEELEGQEGQEAHQEEGKLGRTFRRGSTLGVLGKGRGGRRGWDRVDDTTRRARMLTPARHTPPIQAKGRGALQRHPGAATTNRPLDLGALAFPSSSPVGSYGYRV